MMGEARKAVGQFTPADDRRSSANSGGTGDQRRSGAEVPTGHRQIV
jgi:hypothetical protein